MSFIERVFKDCLEKTLDDVLEHAKNRLTKTEQAQLLILIAEKLNVKPRHIASSTVNWRTYQSSAPEMNKNENRDN